VFDVTTLKDLLYGRSNEELSCIAAYFLAPALVVGLAVGNLSGSGLGLDLAKPAAVTRLATEVDSQGRVASRPGVAITIEPIDSEYSLPIAGATKMWLSLGHDMALANTHRLVLTQRGLSGRSPLIGVSEPVVVVIEGQVGDEMLIPGSVEQLEDWHTQSRRSLSLVSSTLLACVFAFGMALATGFPSMQAHKETSSKNRT
jgi:hypothetical protein